MTVDRLSGGRLVLSAGLGVAEDAEDRFWIFEHNPKDERVRSRLLTSRWRLCLGCGGASHSWGGTTRCGAPSRCCRPTPVQQPRHPDLGGRPVAAARSMRRVARLDGRLPNYAPPGEGAAGPDAQRRLFTPEIGAEAMAWLRAERERLGLADRPVRLGPRGHDGGPRRRGRCRGRAPVGGGRGDVEWLDSTDWYGGVPSASRRRAGGRAIGSWQGPPAI